MVVDQVERALARSAEGCLSVRELQVFRVTDPGIARRAVAHRCPRHAAKRGAGQRIAAREQRHVMTAGDELFGDQVDDELGPAIGPRRHPLVRRCKLRDPHSTPV